MFDRVSQYGTDPMSRGAANMQALTVPRYRGAERLSAGSEADEGTGDAEHPATGGNPLVFVFLLLALIVVMFFLRRASGILQQETFGINWFSFVQTGVLATFFILLLKTVFGRWHVPGITNAVAAI